MNSGTFGKSRDKNDYTLCLHKSYLCCILQIRFIILRLFHNEIQGNILNGLNFNDKDFEFQDNQPNLEGKIEKDEPTKTVRN